MKIPFKDSLILKIMLAFSIISIYVFYRIIVLVLFNCNTLFPQWIPQNSNTNQRLLTLFFLDENNGWVGGNEGCIIRTTDGGSNWYYQHYTSNVTLHHIHFIDENFGWAVGSNSVFLRTINGGAIWQEDYISFE